MYISTWVQFLDFCTLIQWFFVKTFFLYYFYKTFFPNDLMFSGLYYIKLFIIFNIFSLSFNQIEKCEKYSKDHQINEDGVCSQICKS